MNLTSVLDPEYRHQNRVHDHDNDSPQVYLHFLTHRGRLTRNNDYEHQERGSEEPVCAWILDATREDELLTDI